MTPEKLEFRETFPEITLSTLWRKVKAERTVTEMAKSEIAPGKKQTKRQTRQTKLLMRVADRLRDSEIGLGNGEVEIVHKLSCRATGTCNCDFDLIFPDRDDAEDEWLEGFTRQVTRGERRTR